MVLRLTYTLLACFWLALLGGSAAVQAEPLATMPAPGMFLVASDEMQGSAFEQAVILLVGVEQDGVLGLVVNRPTPLQVAQVIPGAEPREDAGRVVYAGGPVEDSRLMALVRGADAAADDAPVFDDVYLLADWRLFTLGPRLAAEAEGFRVYAGYAGWAPGQLEQELERGAWHLMPADAELLFGQPPEGLWEQLTPVGGGHWVRLDGIRAVQR